MYYFIDVNDDDFEIGNADQSTFIMDSAKDLGLIDLYDFFAKGWSDSKNGIIKDIESVNWSKKRSYNEVVANLLESVKKARFPIIIPQT